MGSSSFADPLVIPQRRTTSPPAPQLEGHWENKTPFLSAHQLQGPGVNRTSIVVIPPLEVSWELSTTFVPSL